MKKWSKPELKELTIDKTLVGQIDQFPESQPVDGFTTNGRPSLGNS